MSGAGPVNHNSPITNQTGLLTGSAAPAKEGTWNKVKVTTVDFVGEPIVRKGADFKPTSWSERMITRPLHQLNFLSNKSLVST